MGGVFASVLKWKCGAEGRGCKKVVYSCGIVF